MFLQRRRYSFEPNPLAMTNASSPTRSTTSNHLWALVGIVLVCLGLFYLDHETQDMGDLLQPGMLMVLAIYTLPAYLAFALFYHWFNKWNVRRSGWLAFVTGVPMAIGLTMLALAAYLGWLS